MSSSIAIPKRKGKHAAVSRHSVDSSSPSRCTSSSSSSPSSASVHTYKFTPSANRFEYGSYGSNSSSVSASSTPSSSPGMRRRESLMSEAFSRAEHTVINVGEDECPRLITCVKASQGFDWNQEIFLPSYADYHFDDLERRQDPVQDIILTEEEIKNMFPS
ncbi:hypothetical protein PtrSN002B_004042 [Pyrenophora tritici-repentis]|uniref:Uncharacterized protein n=1 Tax=Pyrenophora tritici-repentis TaxID=45151 RepID=A0A2W1DXG0_9PLEO|nr:hypothetical protein PtrV1_02809 [Pyrenophora tritici-repentis]KAF7455562.1 hypothetical protein A1F99_028200 [Pyrenophora tritici-repentis]KAF7578767.1 hypothetical protein PtrM4_030070 [Pyrenophora tritici-repentis]KAG9389316.1 hypothetical protein A1F94_002209 [Pyrenophora tritici-repentis]KAI0587221.1 hypothetical protein Alg130_03928 [Pyrenophora tritici-repentis]